MKKSPLSTLLCLSAFVVVGSMSDGASAVASEYKRYGIERAIVEYEISGTMQSGHTTLQFDDWGRKEATRSRMVVSMMGFTRETNHLEILDGTWQYSIDLDSGTGTKLENTVLKSLIEKTGSQDAITLGKQMMIEMGGKK